MNPRIEREVAKNDMGLWPGRDPSAGFANFASSRSAVLLMLLVVVAGCAAPRQRLPDLKRPPGTPPVKVESSGPLVRVAIALKRPSVRLTAPRQFTMTGFEFGGDAREVTLTADQVRGDAVRLVPLNPDDEVKVDGKPYHGALEVYVGENATLTVVNEVPLEAYLLGVLAGEVPKDWPLEALKAQAVAARTFAVLKRDEARAKGMKWDLESSTLHQVYGGSGEVGGNIAAAVRGTKGIILTYDSKPIFAVFHSNCGGHTSRASDVWSSDHPYLKTIACGFCVKGPHYHWKADLLVSDLVKKLRASGLNLGDVTDLKVLEWDASDRIRKLQVTDADGRKFSLKGSQFRMAVGPDLVKSARFEAEVRGEHVLFQGTGWGHGVGLCQEGACGMAQAGYNAFEILRKYYPGAIKERLKQ